MKKLNLVAWLVLASIAPVGITRALGSDTQEVVSAQERFQALSDEYDAVLEEWSTDLRAKMQAARAAGEELPESAYESPAGEFLAKFQAGADEYAGTDGAAPFLVWIVLQGRNTDVDAAKRSFELLAAEHHSSDALEPLLKMLPYMGMFLEGSTPGLRKLVDNTSNDAVREAARFGLHANLLDEAEYGTPEFDEAIAGMQAIIASIEDENMKQMAQRKLRIAESFATGMVAPDIEGVDLSDVAFKLSDYKGKIIFLDFWGDW